MSFKSFPSNSVSTAAAASGGDSFPFPTMPLPLKNEGYISDTANYIPHKGTAINNLSLPTAFSTTATGDIEGVLDTSVVWTVTPANINAAVDGLLSIVSFWYDNTNDRLWVWGVDTGTTPDTLYTCYITLETGTVTNVGSAILTTDPSALDAISTCAVHRPTISSGNFTLYFQDRTVVINESTGAEVSNVASTNATGSVQVGSYTTADGLITFEKFAWGTNTSNKLHITRNSNSAIVPVPINSSAIALFATSSVIAWGDTVKLYAAGTTSSGLATLKTFNRVEFDAWLHSIADFGGLA